jgi:DNA-directed RNA polymerase specialized sigma24 family protein
VRAFIDEHRALILRHARVAVRSSADKTAVEDVACEIELVLEQLSSRGLAPQKITSPDPFVRAIAKHALGRAKRRRTLIDQLAAGDDLDALSKDLDALDADLPSPSLEPTPEGAAARAKLERLKESLSPRDALLCALLFEDDGTMDEVAEALTIPLETLASVRERVLEKAASQGIILDRPIESRREA